MGKGVVSPRKKRREVRLMMIRKKRKVKTPYGLEKFEID